MKKKRRRYLIPFTFEHTPEAYDFVRVNTTDVKEVKRLASCIFGSTQLVTIAYEDVEEESQ